MTHEDIKYKIKQEMTEPKTQTMTVSQLYVRVRTRNGKTFFQFSFFVLRNFNILKFENNETKC